MAEKSGIHLAKLKTLGSKGQQQKYRYYITHLKPSKQSYSQKH
jgi:hypothetical protein